MAAAVGRAFARTYPKRKTLVIATADHGQTMQVLGLVDSLVPDAHGESPRGSGVRWRVHRVGRRLSRLSDRSADGLSAQRQPLPAGPGASLLTGTWDQTDLFFKMARVLDSDTSKLDRLERERSRLRIVDQNCSAVESAPIADSFSEKANQKPTDFAPKSTIFPKVPP